MVREIVTVGAIAAPQAHYSHGVLARGWLAVAGQVPVAPDGAVVEGDAAEQARQVMDNLAAVVEAAGATLDDVVRTTVYLTDIAHRRAVGEVRRAYFSSPPPANTLLVVAGLADPRFLVEIDALAIVPDAPEQPH